MWPLWRWKYSFEFLFKNTTKRNLIVKKHLYEGDVIKISILDFQVTEELPLTVNAYEPLRMHQYLIEKFQFRWTSILFFHGCCQRRKVQVKMETRFHQFELLFTMTFYLVFGGNAFARNQGFILDPSDIFDTNFTPQM